MSKLYTIGCSTHSQESFLALLKTFEINAVADVRSVPFSKFTPQFNSDKLQVHLRSNGCHYLNFSNEFGARRAEIEAYKNGKVCFEHVRQLSSFLKGVDRIQNGLQKTMRIALMCTEKDPIDCHRFLLVSRGIEMIADLHAVHIHFDGRAETTQEIEMRMLNKLNLQPDLFNSDYNGLIVSAYEKLSDRIAFHEFAEDVHE